MNKKVILLIVSLLSPMHSLSINNENHINITKNDLNLVKNTCIDFMKTVKDTETYLIDILHSNTYIYKETKVNKFLSEIDGNETEFGPYPLSIFENRENISLLYNLRSQHKYDYYFKSDTFMIIGLNNINYINQFKSIFEYKILQNKLNL